MPRQGAKGVGGWASGHGPALVGPHHPRTRAALVGLIVRLKLKQHAVALIDLIDRCPRKGERAEENVAATGIGRNESVTLMLDQRGDDALSERRRFGVRLSFQYFTHRI